MVTPAGFEPIVSGLKGRRLFHLTKGPYVRPSDRADCLCAYPETKVILVNEDCVYSHTEYRCENDDVVQRRHGISSLPLVNGLRSAEAEDCLKIADGEPRVYPKTCYIHSGCGHIYDRYVVHLSFTPVPAVPESEQMFGSASLKRNTIVQHYHLGRHTKKPLASYKASGLKKLILKIGYEFMLPLYFALYERTLT